MTTSQNRDLSMFWPKAESGLPSLWCLPLTLIGVGKLVGVESFDRETQLFRSQNWSAQIQIPIKVPALIQQHFGGMLDDLQSLTLDVFRFHFGSVSHVEDWEDQWFQVICDAHFSYVPCALSPDDDVVYKRLAWIPDDGIMPLAERSCAALPDIFPQTPIFVTFHGFVDTERFPLANDPDIGLDDVTLNSSAVFKTWSKFPASESTSTPKAGWYGNYVYAMLPKCKPHLTQKCERMSPATTPFRKQGKKAYVTGYIHGFCNKKAVFSPSCEYNPLQFVPFVEILKIDWAVAEPRQGSQARDVFSSPAKPSTPAIVNGRVVFDPFAQMSADDKLDRGPRTPTKSGLPALQLSQSSVFATETDDDLQEIIAVGEERSADLDTVDEGSNEPPLKRSKTGSQRGRRRGI